MSQPYTNFIRQLAQSKLKIITRPRGSALLSNTHPRVVRLRGFGAAKGDLEDVAVAKIKRNIFLAFYYAAAANDDPTLSSAAEFLKTTLIKEDTSKHQIWSKQLAAIVEDDTIGEDEAPPELYTIDAVRPWAARYESGTNIVINDSVDGVARIFNTIASASSGISGQLIFMYKNSDLERVAMLDSSLDTLLEKMTDYNVFIDIYGEPIGCIGEYNSEKPTIWIAQKEDSRYVFSLALISYDCPIKSTKNIGKMFTLQHVPSKQIQKIIARIAPPPAKIGTVIDTGGDAFDEQLKTIFSTYREITIAGLGSYILANIHESSNKYAGILLDVDSKAKVGVFRGQLAAGTGSGACEIVWDPAFEKANALLAQTTYD